MLLFSAFILTLSLIVLQFFAFLHILSFFFQTAVNPSTFFLTPLFGFTFCFRFRLALPCFVIVSSHGRSLLIPYSLFWHTTLTSSHLVSYPLSLTSHKNNRKKKKEISKQKEIEEQRQRRYQQRQRQRQRQHQQQQLLLFIIPVPFLLPSPLFSQLSFPPPAPC